MKIRKPKECRKKLACFPKIQFEQHIHAKGEKLPLAQSFFWPDSLPYLGGHVHSFMFIAGAIWCTCTYSSFQSQNDYFWSETSSPHWKIKLRNAWNAFLHCGGVFRHSTSYITHAAHGQRDAYSKHDTVFSAHSPAAAAEATESSCAEYIQHSSLPK